MADTFRVGSYRDLFNRPGVPRTMALAAVGRLGYAMLPLLLLFTISDGSMSFATAATAMAAFGVASFAMPLKGRLIDRHGQKRALCAMAAVTSLILATLSIADLAYWHPARPFWMVMAFAAGVSAPPLGPSSRAQWRRIAPDQLDTAYALDAMVEETLWLVGPALAGTLISVTVPAIALLLVPIALLIGAGGLGWSRWRPPIALTTDARAADQKHQSALKSVRLRPVLLTMGGVGISGALLVTGIAAVADRNGNRSLAAVAEVIIGAGGLIGGAIWGKLCHRPSRRIAATALLTLSAGGVVIVAVMQVNPASAIALVVVGGVSAPMWVLAYQAADDAVPAAQQTEASTWVTTIANLGNSAGTAFGGLLSSHTTETRTLLAPVVVSAFTALVTFITWRKRPHQGHE